MPIQTQKFSPLKHKHYKLATTQSELDEDLRRKMVLQNNQNAANANLANMRQQNANNRQAARQGLQREQMAANKEQQAVVNGLNTRAADRQDAELKADQEETSYQREQDGLDRQRQEKLDGLALERQQKLDKRDDYNFSRQQQEDQRGDAERQRKELFQNKTLALGGLGALMERQINENMMDKKGYVDLSEMKDALGVLVNGYEFRGAPKALVGNDGYVTLYDDDGAIKNNGNPVRIHRSTFQDAAPLAEKYRQQQMGIMAGKGNAQALKDARKDFEYNRKLADQLKKDYLKFQVDNPKPKHPGNDASTEAIAAYNEAAKIHQKFIDKINRHGDDAVIFNAIYEGRGTGGGLTLKSTEPAATDLTAQGGAKKVDVPNPQSNGLAKPDQNKSNTNVEKPSYLASKDPSKVLDSLRYYKKLSNDDEDSLRKAANQGQKAYYDKIMRIRNRVVNHGY